MREQPQQGVRGNSRAQVRRVEYDVTRWVQITAVKELGKECGQCLVWSRAACNAFCATLTVIQGRVPANHLFDGTAVRCSRGSGAGAAEESVFKAESCGQGHVRAGTETRGCEAVSVKSEFHGVVNKPEHSVSAIFDSCWERMLWRTTIADADNDTTGLLSDSSRPACVVFGVAETEAAAVKVDNAGPELAIWAGRAFDKATRSVEDEVDFPLARGQRG